MTMFLRSVELRDWRSYRHARFTFPAPSAERNVILIMAPNEHGKTSFFEAVTLGLFGREGLTLIPRARAASGTDLTERLNMSYSQFLASTLHRRAIESGRLSCAVTIELVDEDGEPIEISRKWHFRPDGAHKLYDDQLTIYEGVGRVPVSPPVGVDNKDVWYRDYVAQRLLPPNLAEFFLFDGEQIQRYANKGMAEQVRIGIEGLLGLPVLRSLKESLARYAQVRRSSAAAPSDVVVKQAEAEIATLLETQRVEKEKRDNAEHLIPRLQQEADELAQQLGGRGEGTVALVSDLVRDEERFRAEAGRAYESLMNLMAEDLALGVGGEKLRKTTIKRLESEGTRERWEAGRSEGTHNLERFKEDLDGRLQVRGLPLDQAQRLQVLALAQDAWEALWYPPPDGCADVYLHPSLTGTLRAQVIERLGALERRSRDELGDLVVRFKAAISTAESKKRERLELEQTAPETDRLSERLQEVSTQLGRLKGTKDEAERALRAADGQVAAKRQELGRHAERIGRGAPALRRAQRADQVAVLVDQLLEAAVPNEVGEVAREMTRAWKDMAHLSDRVDRIEITPECDVRMLNQNGEDLHRIEKSAGASQVFTQALIFAITKVSGETFPFIVDTPLARLSHDQRVGVLRTFTNRTGQVILLSTDEEVVGDKLDVIRNRISAAFELQVTFDKGVAVTSVHPYDIE